MLSAQRIRLSAALKARRHAQGLQANRGQQVMLGMQYRALAAAGGPMPSFPQVEFRNYSQNGEDGILLYLASLLGIETGRCVEICCGHGFESNTANLILNHGWEALLVDGDPRLTAQATAFYAGQPETTRLAPQILTEWITSGGVLDLVASSGFDRDVDLLSLDLDGIDLWVAKALRPIQAKLLLVEINARIPAGRALTVPDSDTFRVGDGAAFNYAEGWFGASLDGFVNLLSEYRLVGVNRYSTNAFFLRRDLLPDLLPEAEPATCLSSRWATYAVERWWPAVADRPWIEVRPNS